MSLSDERIENAGAVFGDRTFDGRGRATWSFDNHGLRAFARALLAERGSGPPSVHKSESNSGAVQRAADEDRRAIADQIVSELHMFENACMDYGRQAPGFNAGSDKLYGSIAFTKVKIRDLVEMLVAGARAADEDRAGEPKK